MVGVASRTTQPRLPVEETNSPVVMPLSEASPALPIFPLTGLFR